MEAGEWRGPSGAASDPANFADVDWIALTSLRDSENTVVMQYSSPNDETSGMTRPRTVASWFKDGGFRNISNETNYVFSKGLPTLLRAAQNIWHGYYVCLLINRNLLKLYQYDEATYHPNH